MQAVIDFISGINAGIAVVAVGQPFDTVKVKLQTFPKDYKNAFHCAMETVRHERIRGLYAGTIPSLAANCVDNSVTFLFYGLWQKVIMAATGVRQEHNLTLLHNTVAGGCAGFCTGFFLTPFELIKCRLQGSYEMQRMAALSSGATNHKFKHIGPTRMVLNILVSEGPRGLFRGLGATVAREVPCYVGMFFGIEGTRHLLTPPGKTKQDLGFLSSLLAGSVGGIFCWLFGYPIDIVKSRIQVGVKGSDKNFLNMMWNIFRYEGIRGLYRGFTPVLARTVPANAALYLAYDMTKKYLTEHTSSEVYFDEYSKERSLIHEDLILR